MKAAAAKLQISDRGQVDSASSCSIERRDGTVLGVVA